MAASFNIMAERELLLKRLWRGELSQDEFRRKARALVRKWEDLNDWPSSRRLRRERRAAERKRSETVE